MEQPSLSGGASIAILLPPHGQQKLIDVERLGQAGPHLLNRSQPSGYGNVVTSPLFGLPTGYTGARTIRLSTNLDF